MPTREIDLDVIIRIVNRRWLSIVAVALIAGVLTLLAYRFVARPRYTATATLVLARSAVITGDEPDVIHSYRALLDSKTVIFGTFARLAEDGVLADDQILRPGRSLRSRVVVFSSGRGPAVASPVIEATAIADDPERAAAIANAWAEVLVDQSHKLGPGSTESAHAALGEQLSATRERLRELEAERLAVNERFHDRRIVAATAWDRRIAAVKEQTDRRLAAFHAETKRRFGEAAERFLDTGGGAGDDSNVAVDRLSEHQLSQAVQDLASIRAELVHSWSRILDSAIGADDQNEVLATALARQPEGQDLTVEALRIESELRGLSGGRATAAERLIEELGGLQLERAATMAGILDQQRLEIATLGRQQARELASIERERNDAVSQIERKVNQMQDLEVRLSQGLNAATMEQVVADIERIRLAARAVPDRSPEPRRVAVRVAVGAFLGGLFAFLVVLYRDA